MICHKAGQSNVVVDTLLSSAGDYSSLPHPLQPGDGCIATCSNLGEAAKGLTEVKAPSWVSFSSFATRADISCDGWVFIPLPPSPGGVGGSAGFLSGLLAGVFIFSQQCQWANVTAQLGVPPQAIANLTQRLSNLKTSLVGRLPQLSGSHSHLDHIGSLYMLGVSCASSVEDCRQLCPGLRNRWEPYSFEGSGNQNHIWNTVPVPGTRKCN
jgi:hypothetical protein